MKLFWTCLFFLVLSAGHLQAQYIVNGSAQKNSCNCYTLTPAANTQSGSVWNATKINLTSSFDFWFNVFLGCNDAGADGIVFILQPISTSVGTTGEGMGFGGVSPSVGIALDTYQNNNLADPAFDHISIQVNGNVNHSGDLAGPVAASSTSDNIEDCNWHRLRISWDAGTKWLRAYFDGVLRVEKQVDLVATVFNNDPAVFWGFTGATGGAVNLQQFCTALDPIFTTTAANNVACEGAAVTFTNTSESFAPIASYNWNFGDGTTSTSASPPPHVYPTPGNYKVTLKIIGQDGCERDTAKHITVAANPFATLSVSDTCEKLSPSILFASNPSGVLYQWTLDGVVSTGVQPPPLSTLTTGPHQLSVAVTSAFGCGMPATDGADFFVWPRPAVNALVADGCVNTAVLLRGFQTDTGTTINGWNWMVGSNTFSNQVVQSSLSTPGNYAVSLWAVDNRGCHSDTVRKKISIADAFLFAKDTTVLQNTPSQLRVQSNGTVVWQPATGLSSATVLNPVATLSADQSYHIVATTPEGCTAEKTLQVKVFRGPAVYVPTAFTPNGDGKNEVLLPVYVGITSLQQFAVFNRWGGLEFSTTDMQKGWSGRGAPGTYVWLVRAVNYLGERVLLKGTVTLIR